MKEEKVFDSGIKALVEEASQSGDWPKEALWLAIEEKQGKKKRAWYYYVAVLLLFATFSGYLMYNLYGETSSAELSQIPAGLETQTGMVPESKKAFKEFSQEAEVRVMANEVPNVKKAPRIERSVIPTVASVALKEVFTEPVKEDFTERKRWKVEAMEPLKTSGLALPEDGFEIALLREDKTASAKTVYLYIPEKGEKERYSKVGKLFKQIGRFNTVGEFDWEEVNVKPQLIWAYLKESTKSQKDN